MKIFTFITCAFQLLFSLPATAQTEKLKDVTFGFAAGYSRNFSTTYDYSLATSDYSLQRQKNSNGSFVISSMISVRFTPLQYDPATKQVQVQQASRVAGFTDRFALNVGLNLLEVSNSVQFNKSVDGGIGLGYYFSKNTQIAFMFEGASVRQIRDWVVDKYLNKPIPNNSSTYNALDRNDNTLFYNKFVTGVAFKVVFGL